MVAQVGNELSENDVVTVTAEDNEENQTSANDDATVNFELIPPTVQITKTDNDATVNEPGGNVTYRIDIKNTSFEPVTVTTLTDTITYEIPAGDTVVDLLNPVAPVSGMSSQSSQPLISSPAHPSRNNVVTRASVLRGGIPSEFPSR